MNWTEADLQNLADRRAGASRRLPEAKPSKYKAVKTTVDGIVFDSKKEAARYGELKLLEKAGRIRGLTVQHKFPLHVPSCLGSDPVVIGHYIADFEYWEPLAPIAEARVVEDVKGGQATKTALYRWKAKHFAAQYGIQIRET